MRVINKLLVTVMQGGPLSTFRQHKHRWRKLPLKDQYRQYKAKFKDSNNSVDSEIQLQSGFGIAESCQSTLHSVHRHPLALISS